MYSLRRWRWSSSSAPASSSRRQATPFDPACFTSFSWSGSTAYGGRENSRYSSLHLRQHAAVFGGGLCRLGHDPQKIQRSAPALAFRIQGLQIIDQGCAGAAVVGQFLFQSLALAAQVTGDRQARLDRREQLRLFLHHLGKSLFHQGIQYFVDLLAGNVGARRQLQRLEPADGPGAPGMSEIRKRLAQVVGAAARTAGSLLRLVLHSFSTP